MSKLVITTFSTAVAQFRPFDPFIFCAYHLDKFPASDPNRPDSMGPDRKLLAGRNIGSDFSSKDGFNMYHGSVVPGFPEHPHRGFETITFTEVGLIDHFDSHGAAGRYGNGDVQWMTAGAGIQHSEMFPLINRDKPNPLQFFQIWLNLPRRSKFASPHFTMMWNEKIPRVQGTASVSGGGKVKLIAGSLDGVEALAPPPESWASAKECDIFVALIELGGDGDASVTLPPARFAETTRAIYHFEGGAVAMSGADQKVELKATTGAQLNPSVAVTFVRGAGNAAATKLLVLQGRSIGEPVVKHGPFVMNSNDEIRQTFMDFQKTRFGGWPWDSPDQTHPREATRFARYRFEGKEIEDRPPTSSAKA